jgi:hypothetical protein
MKKVLVRMALAVMQFALIVYKRIKRVFIKPLDLKMLTVEQLLDSKQFHDELEMQITIEEKHHTEMSYQAVGAGLRLQRAPIQRLIEREVFNADDMIELYKRIVCKQLNGFSAAEREYIKNVCMMAYWRVVDMNKK